MLSMTTRTLGLYAATLLVLFVATVELVPAQSKAGTTMNAVVSVSGMACQDMCAPTLQRRLAKLPDVKAVTVSAEQGQAVVTFALPTKVTDKAIEQAVTEAGFTATKIVWQESSRK